MVEEQIKQNADAYAGNSAKHLQQPYEEYKLRYDAYIAGAHSRDEEIKELEKEVSALETVIVTARAALSTQEAIIKDLRNPWISVEDKLPQLNKICFGMRDGKMPRICMLVKKKNGECVFNTPNEEYEYPKGKITHWMPIPQLTKGE